MSRWKFARVKSRWRAFHFGRFSDRCRGPASGGERCERISFRCRSPVLHITNLVALCALVFVGWGSDVSRAGERDFSVYARAVEFCSGVVKRPMALDLDNRVLCFDGPIQTGMDISIAGALEANGLFVVRSPGGASSTAMALADLLHDRNARVVVYDYCFSACASYLLVASDQAFVVKDTLVGWHHISLPLCPSLEVSGDGGPKRLEKKPCSDAPDDYQSGYQGFSDREAAFFQTRVVDPSFKDPPESFTIRKILRNMFEGTGRYPDVVWTWNPRYYASTLKTKITYQAYPNSQDEVDALVSKLPYPGRVLYDP
jgi:hypothetical protein